MTLLTEFAALDTATVSDALEACGLPPGQGGMRPMWGCPTVAGFAVAAELERLRGEHGGAHILPLTSTPSRRPSRIGRRRQTRARRFRRTKMPS